jgi:integration host factor subunit beta
VEVSARPVPVFKPSKELRAMVAHLDISDIEGDYEEAHEA